MKTNQFEIWLADLNPKIGTEPGKTRPVLIVQTDLLNHIPHPSTIICPITTNITHDSDILRIRINKGIGNIRKPSDIMIDQIRSIDNRRLLKKIGMVDKIVANKVIENLKVVLDIGF